MAARGSGLRRFNASAEGSAAAMAKFRLQRLRGGKKHVIQTDSAADYLRCLIDEMAGDFNVLCHVAVTEIGAGRRGGGAHDWMNVGIESAPEAGLLDRGSEFRFSEFAAELQHVFSAFYDVEVVGATSQSRVWRVRHRRGRPWI
jgi:hypothetical protein